MADAYSDACHAMRRWKTAMKTLVSVRLFFASFSYPARKKSLILRLQFTARSKLSKASLEDRIPNF